MVLLAAEPYRAAMPLGDLLDVAQAKPEAFDVVAVARRHAVREHDGRPLVRTSLNDFLRGGSLANLRNDFLHNGSLAFIRHHRDEEYDLEDPFFAEWIRRALEKAGSVEDVSGSAANFDFPCS